MNVSASDLLATRDCVTPLCVDVAIRGSENCRRHASIAELRAANGDSAANAARPDLGRTLTWSPDAIVAAIKTWMTEQGEPPTATTWTRQGPGRPTYATVRASYPGGWLAALAAAGAPSPFLSGQPDNSGNSKKSGRAAKRHEPAAVETPSPDPPDASRGLEPLREGTTEAAARPAELTDLAQINADRCKVDAHLSSQEPPPELEFYSKPTGGFALALTGDFTQDAARVRAEAELLRAQAEALDVIATGIEQLAETVATETTTAARRELVHERPIG